MYTPEEEGDKIWVGIYRAGSHGDGKTNGGKQEGKRNQRCTKEIINKIKQDNSIKVMAQHCNTQIHKHIHK